MAVNSTYDDLFDQAGRAYNVDPAIPKLVAHMESGANPNTRDSSAGAQGLMGLMPATGRAMGAVDMRDVKQAIFAGTRYIREGLDSTGTVPGALAYYHGGPDRAQWGPKTTAYVAKGIGLFPQMAMNVKGDAVAGSDTSEGDAILQKLLKRGSADQGGASAPASDAMDGDAILKRLLARPGKPKEAPGPGPMETPEPLANASDPEALPNIDAPATARAVGGVGSNILQAGAQGAAQAFGTEPFGMGAPLVAGLQRAGIYPPAAGQGTMMQNVNQAVMGPVAAGVDLAARAGGALFRGGQAMVAQAGTEAGVPGFGRDLAAMPEAFMGSPGMMASGVPSAAIRNNLIREQTVGQPIPKPPVTAAQLIDAVRQADNGNPLTGKPMNGAASPSPGAPIPGAPGSVGAAATPSALTNMAPREAAASRATAENYHMMNPTPEAGDATRFVPGSEPTAAEVARDPVISQQYKVAEQAPGNQGPFVERQDLNNKARIAHYEKFEGTPSILNRMRDARDDQAKTDYPAAFSGKKPTDPTPVVDAIKSVLKDPREAENSYVGQYIKPLLDRFTDGKGNLKTDPESLYGIREDIARMTSRSTIAEKPTLDHVRSQLSGIQEVLDGVIEKGAPGYKQYMENYSAASKPIDVMELLQGEKLGLVNGSERTMTFAKYDKFMRDLIADRQARGNNQAKSIPPETMDELMNIHKDLARKQNLTLGDPKSSPTSMLTRAVKVGDIAMHGAMLGYAPLIGNYGYQIGRNMINNKLQQRTNNKLLTAPPPPVD
jgi:hypothetical protein